MLLERTPTHWPAVQHGVPNNYRAEPLVDAPSHAAPSSCASQSTSTTDNDAPRAQTVPEHGTTRTVLAAKHHTQEASGADIPGDDQHLTLMSVAEVLALAPTAGATGAMEDAAGVAPPPPAATAAPKTATIYTAAASAAEEALCEAQLATGVYQYPDSDSDMEAGGIDADDEGTDGSDSFFYGSALFLGHPFGAFGTWSAWPTLAAGTYNGGVEDAAPSKSGFPLSPVDWSRVDAAGRYLPAEDNDVSTISDED